MRRIRLLGLLLAMVSMLSLPVAAATGLTGLQNQTAVAADGSCRVSLTIGLHLDSSVSELSFPLPLQAQDITLNGSHVWLQKQDGALQLPLSVSAAGDYTFSVQYSLPGQLEKSGSKLLLSLPLLHRFSYPIENFSLTLTLPGPVTGRPEFVSGYHQADTDRLISHSIMGNTVVCTALETLKDHETLTMTLEVDPELFPNAMTDGAHYNVWDSASLCLAVLALLYYLLTLLPRLPRRTRCYCAPDGISAGDVGTCLTGRGTDLSMLVMSWAQAGYLCMELDRKGRVLLHRRMEMGNERSRYEVDCFHALFGKRATVDGTGYHYATLCRKMHRYSPLLRQLFLPSSGNVRLLRLLCCAAAACGGVSLAVRIGTSAAGQVLLSIVLLPLCAGAGWCIQSGGPSLPLRDRRPVYGALLCSGLWALVGLLCSSPTAVPMVLFQLAAGLAVAFGGRRSELGRRGLSQLLGLRHYMQRSDSFELQRLLQVNPNYFYELAPYALAMGVDRKFARRFGRIELPDCSFLITPQSQLTPVKWMECLRRCADTLDERQRRLPMERLLSRR